MSSREIQFLQSEVGTLSGFLAEMSEEHVIERLGFEHRLAEARERLAALELLPQALPLPITFRGAPVDGTRSIDATFATKALRSFVEATDLVAASLVAAELKGSGPIPGKGDRSLRIVDTAIGSFGFELELPPPADDTDGQGVLVHTEAADDPYVRAIETTLALIDKAASHDEDAISDLVAEIHPRAAAKVCAFVKVLADHHALFAVEFEGKRVRLDREDQVQRVMDALKAEDIDEAPRHAPGHRAGRAARVPPLRGPPDGRPAGAREG